LLNGVHWAFATPGDDTAAKVKGRPAVANREF
jgi:hypothetical protein